MPLLVLPAAEAFERIRNETARWPGRTPGQAGRLSPVAKPTLEPSFRFGREDLIFTIGSCFARNLEKQLMIEGYNPAFASFRLPPEAAAGCDQEVMLHRYVPQSIANELAWALPGEAPFPEACYYQEPGGWRDLQLHVGAPAAPLEAIKARRLALADYMATAARARVFIMTVGLAEAWFDRTTGLYLNAAPPARARKLFPDRFEFHLLSHDDILAGLEQVHAVLARRGREDLRMLVTVSPVALSTTFTGSDILVANSYMKSALRTAVETFVRGHDNVDYLPSYESVVLSERPRAWRDDGAHVSDELVRLNVLRMLQAYSSEPGEVGAALEALEANDHIHAARQALAWDLPDRALASYRAAVAAAPQDGLVLLEVGRFLMGRKCWDEAQPIVERSLQAGAGVYGGWYCLARIHYERRRYRAAWDAAVRALEQEPDSSPLINLCADLTLRLGRREEALVFAEQHCRLEPESVASRRRLEKLRKGPGLFGRRRPRGASLAAEGGA